MRTCTHSSTQAHTPPHEEDTHVQNQWGDEVTIAYFSGFQQDLSLLLVLPLLLDSLQLLKEAKLRTNVRRLLIALVVLTSTKATATV